GLVLDDGDAWPAHFSSSRLSRNAQVSVNRPDTARTSPKTVVSTGRHARVAKIPARTLNNRALTTWAVSRRRAEEAVNRTTRPGRIRHTMETPSASDRGRSPLPSHAEATKATP